MNKSDVKKRPEKVGDIDAYLGYWLRFVSNQVTASFQSRLLKKDVTVAEWILLRSLMTHAPCSLTKLAQEIGIDKGAVSRLSDRLEKRGLIVRSVSEDDRRLFSIELTPTGLSLIPKLAQIADDNDQAFFGHLDEKEIAKITSMLKEIVNRHGIRAKPIN